MCGIVGVVGLEDCAETLLDSLKRLEYRGYDSSGIVTQCGEDFSMVRAVGKLNALATSLRKAPLAGRSGIKTPGGRHMGAYLNGTPIRMSRKARWQLSTME